MTAYQQQKAQQQAHDQWAQQFGYQQRQDSLDREWQQTQLNNSNKQYQDSLNQYGLEMALQLGDYSKLVAAGYDTSYVQKMQQAELSKILSQSAKKSSAKKAVEEEPVQAPVGNTVGNGWVSVSGYGRLGFEEVDKLLQSGAVREVMRNGKLFYEKVK